MEEQHKLIQNTLIKKYAAMQATIILIENVKIATKPKPQIVQRS